VRAKNSRVLPIAMSLDATTEIAKSLDATTEGGFHADFEVRLRWCDCIHLRDCGNDR
jgi:hypothetical protein